MTYLRIWRWTVSYWLLVCLCCVLLPLWVSYINREDDFSSGDQTGLFAAFIPALIGLILSYVLYRLLRLARKDPSSAGDYGQHLGFGLIILSVISVVLSLLTYNGLFFLIFIFGLFVPAGIFTATSSKLAQSIH